LRFPPASVSCIFLKLFQKKLDFRLKVIGGEISAIPGISDALEVCNTLIFVAESWDVVFLT
jgi:hypothetical protein